MASKLKSSAGRIVGDVRSSGHGFDIDSCWIEKLVSPSIVSIPSTPSVDCLGSVAIILVACNGGMIGFVTTDPQLS